MNIKLTGFFILLGIFSVTALLQPFAPPAGYAEITKAPTPRISLPQPSFNFGKASQGDIITHGFVVKNVGTAELNILRVVPGCGCTATDISKRDLAPGEESIIKVDFNTAGFLGKKVRNISVETNDPLMPVSVLTMQGNIEVDVTVRPKAVNFGEVTQGQTARSEFTLTLAEGSKTKISDVSTRSKHLSVSKVKQNGQDLVYAITIDSSAQEGTLRGMVTVRLNDQQNTSLTVPVFASIVSKSG